jgi:hypothetical protein
MLLQEVDIGFGAILWGPELVFIWHDEGWGLDIWEVISAPIHLKCARKADLRTLAHPLQSADLRTVFHGMQGEVDFWGGFLVSHCAYGSIKILLRSHCSPWWTRAGVVFHLDDLQRWG